MMHHLRTIWIAFAVVSPASVGSVPMEQAAPPSSVLQTLDSATAIYEIDGLTVIHRRSPSSEGVAVNLYLLGGTQQLSSTTAGIEPLLLLASEFGTRDYPGFQTRRALARTGGTIVVEAEADWTMFGMRSLVETFDSTWAVFADRIMHPTLDSAGVESTRSQLLGFARRKLADPEQRARALAMATAFRDHPYEHDVWGTEESLAQIAMSDLEQYHADYTVTSRMLLVVVGNIPLSHLRDAVGRSIGQLPRGDFAWQLPTQWTAREPTVTAAPAEIPTNYVFGVFPGPLASDDDQAAFEVAVGVLSALISRCAHAEGLSYSAGAFVMDAGVSSGAVYFSAAAPERLVLISHRVIRLLRDDAEVVVGLHQLKESVRESILSYYLSNETSDEQADLLGRTYLYRGVVPSVKEYLERLLDVSRIDIELAVRRYIKNIQYAFVGDTIQVPSEQMRTDVRDGRVSAGYCY